MVIELLWIMRGLMSRVIIGIGHNVVLGERDLPKWITPLNYDYNLALSDYRNTLTSKFIHYRSNRLTILH